MLNWIVLNRTDYLHKDGFGVLWHINKGWYAIKPNQPPYPLLAERAYICGEGLPGTNLIISLTPTPARRPGKYCLFLCITVILFYLGLESSICIVLILPSWYHLRFLTEDLHPYMYLRPLYNLGSECSIWTAFILLRRNQLRFFIVFHYYCNTIFMLVLYV